MSKIALSSNASGTGVFTIESPNSDTDRTLTLPDEAGEFVLSAGGVINNFTSTGIDDNATSTAITIDSSGHAIIPAGVTLGTAAGTYNAANTLDDYEEGTFTPTVTTSSGTLTFSNQQGSYVKIGDVVYYWIRVVATNSTTATLSNVESLPYSTSAYSNFYAGPTVGNAYNINLGTGGTVLGAYYLNGSSGMRLHSYGNNTGQLAPSVAAGASFEVRFEGHYRTTA